MSGEAKSLQDYVSQRPQYTLWENVARKDGDYVVANLPGTMPQTAANFTRFIVFRYPVEIIRVTETHVTAGTDAGAVTLDVQKLTGTTAPGSGTSILTTTFSLKSTANTTVTKEGANLSSARQVKEGEGLCLTSAGVLTALASVNVTIYFKAYGRGDYR